MVWCNQKECFCFICGKFVTKQNRRNRTENLVKLYRKHFDYEWFEEHELPYVPQYACSTCASGLTRWSKGTQPGGLGITSPMVWIDPRGSHWAADCYYCINYNKVLHVKKRNIEYQPTTTAHLPILATETEKVPPYIADGSPTQGGSTFPSPIISSVETKGSKSIWKY